MKTFSIVPDVVGKTSVLGMYVVSIQNVCNLFTLGVNPSKTFFFGLVGLQNYCSIGAPSCIPLAVLSIVTLHIKTRWTWKVETCPVGRSGKRFCHCKGVQFADSGGVYGAAMMCTTPREECNKYDLTTIPYFWLANHNDCSRWVAISSSQLLAQFQFFFLWAGLWKSDHSEPAPTSAPSTECLPASGVLLDASSRKNLSNNTNDQELNPKPSKVSLYQDLAHLCRYRLMCVKSLFFPCGVQCHPISRTLVGCNHELAHLSPQ